jgi:ABC-type uncharacterized transport system involved in gliding motility auxiliary subunit
MAGLEDPVTITAYFTEDLPPPYSSNARYVRDLLEEFRAASKGRLSFEFLDPMTQETAEDKEAKKEVKRDIFGRVFREPTSVEKELAQAGVQPVEVRVIEEDQMQTKRAYMGIVIKHQEKKEVIPVVQDVRTLEYDLTTLVRKLTRPKTPVIGVVQGHDAPVLHEKLRHLQTLLSQMYEVRPVDLAAKERLDADIDALLVIGPKTQLQTNELKAIDQFVMEGKSVAFFLDSVQVNTQTFEPSEATHGLGALLETYGIKVGDQLVADVESAQLNVQERRGFMIVSMPVPYPFIPLLERLEGESPVTQGLGRHPAVQHGGHRNAARGGAGHGAREVLAQELAREQALQPRSAAGLAHGEHHPERSASAHGAGEREAEEPLRRGGAVQLRQRRARARGEQGRAADHRGGRLGGAVG